MQKSEKAMAKKKQKSMTRLGKVTKLTLGTWGCRAEVNSPGTSGGCK